MSKYEAPFSDDQRLNFLKRCSVTAASDQAAGRVYLAAATSTSLPPFITQFEATLRAVPDKQSLYTQEVDERLLAAEHLKVYARDFREGLQRRVYRENLPAAVLEKYSLQQDGSVVEPASFDGWVGFSDKLVSGEALAVAAGFEAMSNPTAAQLGVVLAKARTESVDVAEADRELGVAQQQLATVRAAADTLIHDIVEDLRYNLRKLEASTQRRIMRTYGVQFRYLPGETPDPEEEVLTAEPVAA